MNIFGQEFDSPQLHQWEICPDFYSLGFNIENINSRNGIDFFVV